MLHIIDAIRKIYSSFQTEADRRSVEADVVFSTLSRQTEVNKLRHVKLLAKTRESDREVIKEVSLHRKQSTARSALGQHVEYRPVLHYASRVRQVPDESRTIFLGTPSAACAYLELLR